MKCDKCKTRNSNHQVWYSGFEENLCCVCYIQDGNPPADWHSECMREYHKLKETNNGLS